MKKHPNTEEAVSAFGGFAHVCRHVRGLEDPEVRTSVKKETYQEANETYYTLAYLSISERRSEEVHSAFSGVT